LLDDVGDVVVPELVLLPPLVCEPLLPEELLADDLLPEDVASEEELVDDDSDDSLSVDVASEEVALRCDVVAAVEVLVSGEDFVDDDSVVVPVHAVPGAGTRAAPAATRVAPSATAEIPTRFTLPPIHLPRNAPSSVLWVGASRRSAFSKRLIRLHSLASPAAHPRLTAHGCSAPVPRRSTCEYAENAAIAPASP